MRPSVPTRYPVILLALTLLQLACGRREAPDTQTDGERWWGHVQILADDSMQGRNTGTEGHRKAAEYVAAMFERNGLQPGGTSGYYQPVSFHSRRIQEDRSTLELTRDRIVTPLSLGEDATIQMRVVPVETLEAAAVFAGYGLVVPEAGHDDLQGLDLQGKLAVFITGSPRAISGPLRAHYQSAAERWKALQRAGAVGMISIQNPKSSDIPWERSALARLQPSMTLQDPSLDDSRGMMLSVNFNPARAEKLFEGTGQNFEQLLTLAGSGETLPRFPLKVSFRSKIEFESSEADSPNVAGILPGSDPSLKNEFIVVSAHLDHVGIGAAIHDDPIYNGAMDNASGVASLLEISRMMRDSGNSLRRSIVFLAVTGEEKGLLGSRYFAAHPTVPPEWIVANLNFDMFLPLFPLRRVMALGLEESDLGALLREAALESGVEVQSDPEPERNRFIRSDQYSFIRRGVPALAFKFGYLKDSPEDAIQKEWTRHRYHAPSDDLEQPVDRDAAGKFNRLMAALLERIANRIERPQWNPDSFFRRFAE